MVEISMWTPDIVQSAIGVRLPDQPWQQTIYLEGLTIALLAFLNIAYLVALHAGGVGPGWLLAAKSGESQPSKGFHEQQPQQDRTSCMARGWRLSMRPFGI